MTKKEILNQLIAFLKTKYRIAEASPNLLHYLEQIKKERLIQFDKEIRINVGSEQCFIITNNYGKNWNYFYLTKNEFENYKKNTSEFWKNPY